MSSSIDVSSPSSSGAASSLPSPSPADARAPPEPPLDEPLSAEQEAALASLRTEAASVYLSPADAAAGYWSSDAALVRFLVARKWSVPAALAQYSAAMAWRAQAETAGLLASYAEPLALSRVLQLAGVIEEWLKQCAARAQAPIRPTPPPP